MSNIKRSSIGHLEAKHEAFPYQAEAFCALKDLEYSAIFHEQGLGKTKIAIDLALYWLNTKDIDCVVIITKKQLVDNWVNELKDHTYIKPRVLGTDKGKNYSVLNSSAKIIVTNFETVVSELERMALFLKSRSVATVIDESTKLKNPEANVTRSFFEISKLFKIRVIMTGTPVANRPYDIWSQIYFLDEGESLGNDFKQFKRQTDLSNKLAYNECAKEEFEKNVGGIFGKIERFSVRETKESSGIQLPEKKYKTVKATFELKQKELYYRILNELEVEISKEGKRIIDDDSESLKRLIRLNQVASNPKLIDDSYNNRSGKEVALENIIKEIVERDEKCIIWSCYIDNIDQFSEEYKQFSPRKIHGSLTIDERNRSVEIFKNDDKCKLLFATPQAAKEGLTLTVANNAVFYDRSFNLDDYLQAQDRIHRISQSKECTIYNIVIEESIDKWIDALLTAKQYAAFLAQGDLDIEEYAGKADYSYGEMIKEILAEGNQNV